jgi:hypothetical protein
VEDSESVLALRDTVRSLQVSRVITIPRGSGHD